MDVGQQIREPHAPPNFVEMNVTACDTWRIKSPWDGLNWKELAPPERMCFAILDWTEKNWNEDWKPPKDKDYAKTWYESSWEHLDENQKNAALRLGFSQETWDEIKGTRSKIECQEFEFVKQVVTEDGKKDGKQVKTSKTVMTESLLRSAQAAPLPMPPPTVPMVMRAPVGTAYGSANVVPAAPVGTTYGSVRTMPVAAPMTIPYSAPIMRGPVGTTYQSAVVLPGLV
jgi:hypothetical protein